jgi:uncharacterized membrane protein YesL
MRTPWFKRNKWKSGWVPLNWRGWLVMLVYLIALIYDFYTLDQKSHSVSDTLMPFFLHLILLSGILSIICYFTAERSADLLS